MMPFQSVSHRSAAGRIAPPDSSLVAGFHRHRAHLAKGLKREKRRKERDGVEKICPKAATREW